MATRRTLLGQTVALVAGGFLTAGGAAGRPTGAQQGSTVSITLDTEILSVTGTPATLAPRISAFTHRYGSLSLRDIDRLSGRARVGGTQITAGYVLAEGSFNTDGLRNELEENEPQFVVAPGQSYRGTGGDEKITRFVDEDSGELIELHPDRIAVARGQSEVKALRSQSAGLAPTGHTAIDGLTAVLDGNAVAVGTAGSSAKQYLHRRLAHLSESSHRILDALRGGGVSMQVGRRETRLRYALAVDERTTEADFEAVTDEFDSATAVTVTDTTYEQSRWLVDGTVPTASLWEAHERFLGIQ